ncbi:hypothetical protein XNC1_4401 [Xenorhabdus nematophila ATCC 19061]|uniref:Uncharacterized protein n=1 Tax=Xenorhabdus nematophila (strain ATCC 19061 / DSM 3370 / CCUG 14189 / LMG 1036 / NCIMB 9965 / AN6) TaxID=406817 RepID=D3VEH2_XENNA|nr:hypothetical protein XNC1_4401 [Xenorhabdus nematophila ATCC 19061]CEF31254.1 hypothetical protein XNW1_3290006 [Xenorhabdus nematophila str. Websteri]CEK25240.1 hypothetical protein XNC2_4253 [Xenorhabdus nematophila AN6/1]
MFFIHPFASLPIILHLNSLVIDSANIVTANDILYVVDNTLKNMDIEFDQPEIINF